MVLQINLEFSGGAELLVGNQKKHQVTLPDWSDNSNQKTWTIKSLLVWIKENLLKQRPELFLQDESIRPGILILINESDWDLMGNLDYELKANDTITFISTLHGG